MPDFSHLKALEQKGDASFPYKMEQIEGAPTIWFRPATDANKDFLNETLRRANERAGRSRRGARITPDSLEASRAEDKEVIAKTCAVAWDVKDAKGKAVEFNETNCLEFFQALPDWLFDEIRGWVTNPTNFLNVPKAGPDRLGEA